ncbi:MAG: cupin domain-containing protein [Phycisphaerae bacterium]|nr:cupin domain-containing protein [Phycisphaerae bacterium]
MTRYKIDFEAMPWESPAPGVRSKVFEQSGKRLRLAEFTPDFVEADWCLQGHTGYVLEGQVEIDFDGKVVLYNAGDSILIPAGEKHKHKARVLSEVVKIFLVEDVR